MTVAELIARLQTCNQNDEIEWSDDQGETPILGVEEEDGFVFLVPEEEEDGE